MSVFQLNDWWTVQVSSTEEFDHGSMCVGNIDNAYPAMDKIVVGSLAGMLRIYSPTKPVYRIEDLVIEEDLGAPILQLLMGKFIPSTDSLGLAVLHPRKLSVYEVVPQGNKEGRATHHTMRKAYEHNLGLDGGKHFTAFNMTSGPFGGVRGRDMILVQSLDGKLQVFEQSANAFTRQLVDCLLPGPVAYLSRMDAFVTTNYACQSECYRYQVLAASSGETSSAPVVTLAKGGNENNNSSSSSSSSNATAFGVSAIRNALVEWSINVGESCRQIEEGCYTRATSNNSSSSTTMMGSKDSSTTRNSGEVLVLCDKSIFLLKDSGGIIQQRRLEKEPCCFAKYAVGGSAPTAGTAPSSSSSSSSSSQSNDGSQGHNFILACRDGTLQVYSEFNLVWAAKLPASSSSSSSVPVPVQVAVAQFGDQRGLVVTLDDAGRLLVGYMGTKPPLATVPSLMPSSGSSAHSSSSSSSAHREVDYDRLDEEHRALLQVIRESQSTEGKAKEQPKDRLLIRAQVPRSIDLDAATGGGVSTNNLPSDYLVPLSTFSVGNAHVAATSSSGGAHRGGNNNNNNLLSTNGYVKVCLKVYLTHSGDKPATNVSIVLSCPSFLHAEPKNVVIQRIGGASATPVLVKFYLYATKACLPSGLDVQVVATYTSPGGDPRVSTHSVPLPLAVACRLKPASKNATHKLTLDTPGVPALSLTELFEDMVAANAETGSLEEVPGQANAMGFQMWSSGGSGDLLPEEGAAAASSSSSSSASAGQSVPASSLVSILVSKNAGRYRVQSDSMPALFLVVDELEKRLNARLAQKGVVATASSSQGRLVSTEDTYPLNDYFAVIRAHFHTRRQLADQVSLLNDSAHQFRMVQKRLLVRFKDRNPTPLGGLDALMKESYASLITTSDTVQESQRRVGRLMGDLTNASRLITLLATMRCGLSPQERLILDSFLCPQLEEGLGGEQSGWEELVDASLTYLLKTSLAKNVKETASLPGGALELPSDLDGLLKHIQMVLDRLGKGGRLIVESSANAASTATGAAVGAVISSS